MKAITKKLHKLCTEAGLRLEDCGNGHYKIHGLKLVNYWPESKNRKAYIVGQGPAQGGVTAEHAVMLAEGPPKPEKKSEPERYTARTNLPKDETLMRAARDMQQRHGLPHTTELKQP